MHPIRAYVDTSVFGGAFDEEFGEASVAFFDRVRRREFVVLVSSVSLDEMAAAPQKVREMFAELSAGHIMEVPVNDEIRELAQAYIEAGVLSERWRDDATHVAAATVARADLIVSWNFRHIVNFDRIRKFNGVNALHGFPALDIRSPLEMGSENEIEQDL